MNKRADSGRIGSKTEQDLTQEIVGQIMRRQSTAVVLFHHAVAERLGLGPTDHKCLDLLREHGAMTGSKLAAITGLTTGAITGVVARLERAGYLNREQDPRDGRKQILSPASDRLQGIRAIFDPIRSEVAELLETYDTHQLTAIAEFLARCTDAIHRHAALLRSESLHRPSSSGSSRNSPSTDE